MSLCFKCGQACGNGCYSTEKPPTPMEAFTRAIDDARVRYGVEKERNRILEILEEFAAYDENGIAIVNRYLDLHVVIDLIKRETKLEE
jgi:ATP-dependent Zn protease